MPIENEVKIASGPAKTGKGKKTEIAAPKKKAAVKKKTVKKAVKKQAVSGVKKTTGKKKEVKVRVEIKDIAPTQDVKPTPPLKPAAPFSPEQFTEIINKEAEKDAEVFAEAQAEEKAPAPKSHSISLYKKISFAFVFLTLALLAIVFYFSFIKVDIVLTPNQEKISSNLIFDVVSGENSLMPGAVQGFVEEITVSESGSFQPSSFEITGEEVVGKAVIYNEYGKNQPLVASTRLLSAENKLYRIKNTVNVPAGGSAEVEIYADTPNELMVVGPTKFSIPGLWAGLQDKIYAETKEPTVYQKQVKRIIGQADIDEAVKSLRSAIMEKAQSEAAGLSQYDQGLYSIDENSVNIKVSGKVGEEKDEFAIEMNANVIVILFDGESVNNLAKEKINATIAGEKKISYLNRDNIIYSLSSYNSKEGTAAVNASFYGEVDFRDSAEILERNKIIGLTRDQLSQYLESLPEIKDYKINFWPSFVDKVPNLINLDRINIKVGE